MKMLMSIFVCGLFDFDLQYSLLSSIFYYRTSIEAAPSALQVRLKIVGRDLEM